MAAAAIMSTRGIPDIQAASTAAAASMGEVAAFMAAATIIKRKNVDGRKAGRLILKLV